ncbi:MAG: hypothetical protein K9L87_00960 [Candidatus Omnitrophica bacterium]|nr:hypothetical protein [Candidatus Omnitrophota bacterium]MCF7892421.1 hypothetical protein [Candidatus Omnitrophota bacterium]MCF7896086.1 hypothetical protein [Candidatus Omnitrophota bacterium]MCF7897319.1 hypothetical protein [Candidatus Omnitrophota bacterium]MCF7909962.1 hypothetical protein [Candidatus Omnitrophota bacterium]
MSIIYEALKKAEGKSPESLPNKNNHPKKPNSKKIILVTLIFIVFALAFILAYNFSSFKKIVSSGIRKNSSATELIEETGAEKTKDILEGRRKTAAKKTKLKQSDSVYRLEGVVFDKDNPFAIINGKRVFKGDKISGFTISKIKIDSVELTDPGSGRVEVLSISF